jgi:hypothetical protein
MCLPLHVLGSDSEMERMRHCYTSVQDMMQAKDKKKTQTEEGE